jgi:DnaJ-class molecular chaperone
VTLNQAINVPLFVPCAACHGTGKTIALSFCEPKHTCQKTCQYCKGHKLVLGYAAVEMMEMVFVLREHILSERA